MFEQFRLPGDLCEAVILYNKGTLSSCLGAFTLKTALENQNKHGRVSVIPTFPKITKKVLFKTDFRPGEHPDVVDLYLVEVEGFTAELREMIEKEQVRSVTVFAANPVHYVRLFEELKEARRLGKSNPGVSLELVFDRGGYNIPETLGQWCAQMGMDTGKVGPIFGDSYQSVMDGKNNVTKTASVSTGLADVYFRSSSLKLLDVELGQMEYRERLSHYNNNLNVLGVLLIDGFDHWVASGRVLVQAAEKRLQGNMLLASESESGVVLCPDSREDSWALGFLLREKYSQCRAIILHHSLFSGEYIYRLQRGAVSVDKYYTILSNVNPEGLAVVSLCSTISPVRAHRIATTAMAELGGYR